jgi:diguanylate cyclase (GGDEF)-like protein/PAS domain S-box-containing protein
MDSNHDQVPGEIKSLISFLKITHQDSIDFLGEDSNIVFWSYDMKTGKMIFTEGLERIYHCNYEDFTKNFWNKWIHPENREVEEILIKAFLSKKPFNIEYKILRADGSKGWVRAKGRPVFNSHQEVICFNGHTHDISKRKFAETELADSASKYKLLVENSVLGVYITQEGRFQYANQQMADMTGYSEQELLEMNSDQFFNQLLDEESKALVMARISNFLSGNDNGSQEIVIIKKDKTNIHAELRSSLITYQGRPALMGTLLDITEKKQAQEMVNHLAYYDTLTGIPNRNLFYKTVNQKLIEAKMNSHKLALMFIDLDQFKVVNDTYGHHAGDLLIKQAAEKMKEIFVDKGFVSRFGGDEFVVLMPYEEMESIVGLANRIIKEIPDSLTSDIKTVPTIGISLFPEHGGEIESLLRFADIAMYHSKRDENRNQNYSIYNGSLSNENLRLNKLSSDLQNATELGQFYLVYQPKIDLCTNQVEGIEALIRWAHPEYGNISPLDFIPLAEKNGQINKIGDWVLEKAISDIKKMDDSIMLNVNISAKQLLQDSFGEKIQAILKANEFPAKNLNLEITESVALYDIGKTVGVLEQLGSFGIRISLDDFGTGYSSLSYLTRLPVHYLKIDQSFVNEMEHDNSKRTIVKSIISVAHSLNLKVVAEGIETREQAELLAEYHCDIGQGYYFSRPQTFDDLLKYMASH